MNAKLCSKRLPARLCLTLDINSAPHIIAPSFNCIREAILSERTKIFVACPYKLFPMDDYRNTYASIEKSYPVKFIFADQEITNQHILNKIYSYIHESEASIFDITGWNPNVTLELGIAVGLEKKNYILYNTSIGKNKGIPSDIQGIDRVQYESNTELEPKLALIIKQIIPYETEKSDSIYQAIKSKIIECLSKSPGMSISKLAESIQEEKFLVQSIVKAMIHDGNLKTKGQRKGTKYFTAQTDLRKHRTPS